MHFRLRKNVIQLIRTTYDPTRKKGVNATVGRVMQARPELSEELRAKLSRQEIEEFNSWVATRHRLDMLRAEVAALTLAEVIAEAEKWFEREGDTPEARSAAADVVFAMQSLRRRFTKAGLLD